MLFYFGKNGEDYLRCKYFNMKTMRACGWECLRWPDQFGADRAEQQAWQNVNPRIEESDAHQIRS